jgi:hypothetical protein
MLRRTIGILGIAEQKSSWNAAMQHHPLRAAIYKNILYFNDLKLPQIAKLNVHSRKMARRASRVCVIG